MRRGRGNCSRFPDTPLKWVVKEKEQTIPPYTLMIWAMNETRRDERRLSRQLLEVEVCFTEEAFCKSRSSFIHISRDLESIKRVAFAGRRNLAPSCCP